MLDSTFSILFAVVVALMAAAMMAYWEIRHRFNRWKELQLKETTEGLTADEWEELEKLSNG